MTTPILKVLEWLWKWQKNSGVKFSRQGEETTRYLGAREKGMVGDVRNFLQEIRMQDKLPDILRQRNISVEEFKRLEELHKLYVRSRGGDEEAQRILTERFGNDPDRSLEFDAMIEEYDGVKEEMHTQGENFVLDPIYISPELDIPDLSDEPINPDYRSPSGYRRSFHDIEPRIEPREELAREFLDRLNRSFPLAEGDDREGVDE